MSSSAYCDRAPGSRLPHAVVFDVNETLSDMAPLADALEEVGLDRGSLEPWFAGVLRDGFALTSVGVNPSFAEVASESLSLRLAAQGETGQEAARSAGPEVHAAVAEVMGTFAALGVHEDVADGVHRLRELGVRLVTLSNGSTTLAEALLERAGLSEAFETLMSVEHAPAWKPHPASYAYALSSLEVDAGDAMLVAVHPWDVDGAARAGLRSCWLNRTGARYPAYFTAPDVEVSELGGLARALT